MRHRTPAVSETAGSTGTVLVMFLRQSVLSHLLELITMYGWDSRIIASHTSLWKISRCFPQFPSVRILIIEMGEVKASHAVCLEFEETRSDDGPAHIQSLRGSMLCGFEKLPGAWGESQVFAVGQSAITAQADISQNDHIVCHPGVRTIRRESGLLASCRHALIRGSKPLVAGLIETHREHAQGYMSRHLRDVLKREQFCLWWYYSTASTMCRVAETQWLFMLIMK